MAWFKSGPSGKRGFINVTGKTVIAPRFDAVLDFHEGLAPVPIGRFWGYVDRSGKMAIPPRFQAAFEFHDGRARVQLWDRTRCGKRIYTKDNAPEMAFLQSPMPDCFPDNPQMGYVDRTGAFVTKAQFRFAADFSEGLAAVSRSDSQKCEFIDPNGKTAISTAFDRCNSFSEGLAAVLTGLVIKNNMKIAGKRGFIDKSGRFGIEAQFEFVGGFNEGLAAVMLKFLTSDRFRDAESFSDGLAIFGENYIDRTGRIVSLQ